MTESVSSLSVATIMMSEDLHRESESLLSPHKVKEGEAVFIIASVYS